MFSLTGRTGSGHWYCLYSLEWPTSNFSPKAFLTWNLCLKLNSIPFLPLFNIHQCNGDMLLLTVFDNHRLTGQWRCHTEVLGGCYLKAKAAGRKDGKSCYFICCLANFTVLGFKIEHYSLNFEWMKPLRQNVQFKSCIMMSSWWTLTLIVWKYADTSATTVWNSAFTQGDSFSQASLTLLVFNTARILHSSEK